MSRFSCLVQQRGPAHVQDAELEGRLTEHHARFFTDDVVSVSWFPVAAGYMFTEGRQSTSSIIACTLAHETTRDLRERYMRGICDLWSDVTGCTDHEIVVSITEAVPSATDH